MKYFGFVYFLFYVNAYSQVSESTKQKYETAIRKFVECSEPSIYYEGDTLVVSRFPLIPDTLNGYVNDRLLSKDYSLLKYSVLLSLKLQKEYMTTYGSDYDFCDYLDNYLILMLATRMNINLNEESCSFVRTYDIYLWVRKNKGLFRNYEPVMRYIKDIDSMLSK